MQLVIKLFIGVLAVAFLLADGAWAFSSTGQKKSLTPQLQNEQGVLLARRRRRRPPKKKPAPTPAPAPEPAEQAVPIGPRGRTRIEFDAQLIKGQTTKAGEVQVLERRDSELKSMVKRRTSYRKEIIRSVFPSKK